MYNVKLHQTDVALGFKLQEKLLTRTVTRGEIVHKKMTQSCYNLPLHYHEIHLHNKRDISNILSVRSINYKLDYFGFTKYGCHILIILVDIDVNLTFSY